MKTIKGYGTFPTFFTLRHESQPGKAGLRKIGMLLCLMVLAIYTGTLGAGAANPGSKALPSVNANPMATNLVLGGYVWFDQDLDGNQDGTEDAYRGAVVKLYQDANQDNVPDGAALASTSSNSSGNYSFTGLSDGSYIVGITLAAGYINGTTTATSANPNNDNMADNNGIITSGGELRSNYITITDNGEPTGDGDGSDGNLTLDFGLQGDCSCSTGASNLLTNAGFESGTTGWSVTNGSLGYATQYTMCGTYYGYLQQSSGTGVIYQTVPMLPGANVSLGAFVGTHTAGLTCSPKLSLLFLNASNTVLSQSDVVITRDVDTYNNLLEYLTINGTAPAGTAYARVQASITCNYIKIEAVCLTSSCTAPSQPAAISGTTSICTAATSTLGSSPSGGSWSSSNTSVATVNSSSGLVTGMGAGTATITYTVTNSCGATNSRTTTVTVTAPPSQPSAITGTTSICAGGTSALGSSPLGGTWSSSNTAVASVNSSGLVTALTAGTSVITYTVSNTCGSASRTASVTVTALAIANNSQTNVTCNGASTGAVTVAASGCASPYTYKINSGSYQSSGTFTGLAAGTYTVTAKDNNNVTNTLTVTITQPAAITPSITAQGNVSCFGGTNGSVTVSATGGTGTLQYKLNSGTYQANGSFSAMAAGTYTVTVKDANECTATQTVTITQPAVLAATIASQTNVLCFGGSTGSVTITATGGTTPDQFKMGSGSYQSSGTFSGLNAGAYTVTVKDANNCTATSPVTITQPVAALATSSTQTNVLCYGNSTGAIDLTVTGGTAAYTYAWTKTGVPAFTATTQDLSGLSAGTYNVTVTDANSCTSTGSVTITQPAAALATSSTQTNVACNGGSTGAIDLTVTGGTTAYTYSWTKTGVPAFTASTQDLSGLTTGTYNVTVTDANNCTATSSVTVTQPAAALAASIGSQTNVGCYGASTGSVTITATGGTTAYQYKIDAGSYGSSNVFSGLAAGAHSVAVKDANNCTATSSITITQPAAALATSATQTNVACNGGSTGAIDLTVTGGTAAYTYSWTKTGVPAFTASTQDLSGLTAGTYNVTVTDANSCTSTASVTISENTTLSSSISSQSNVGCYGASTGSVTITVTGGTTAYQYKIDAGSYGSSNVFSGLAAGSHTVTVKDANNCTATSSITITQPAAALATSSTQTNVACNGGSTGAIDLTVTGGTTAYTYSWTKTGVPAFTASTQDLSGLTAGTYNVTVTDANNCTSTASVTISENTTLSSSIGSQTNVGCYGASTGSVTITATGGTTAYQYKIDAGSYGSSNVFSGLAAGAHSVAVKDANNCTATSSITITQPAAALATSSTQTNVACNGGSTGAIDLTVTGGTAAYTYSWTKTGVPAFTASTQDLSGLTAGTYNVTVTDANSCTSTASVTISENTTLTSSISSQTNVGCYGASTGSVTITATGGTTAYQYKIDAGSYGSSNVFSGLAAGSHTVTVKDANNCTATSSITITQPAAALATSSTQTNVACNGGSTGAIDLTVTGGTSAYTYSWTKTGVPAFTASTQDLSGLTAGTYNVTVTDANSCTSTASVTISENTTLTSSIGSQTNVGCYGASTGSVTITATGGTTAYQYKIDAGSYGSSNVFSGLAAGTHSVTVKDANNCTATSSITITQPAAALATSSTQTNVACNGGSTGAIDLTVTGGTSAYTYSWTKTGVPAFTASTQDLSGLTTGTYNVTVTDANNCTATSSVTITQPAAALAASISSQSNVGCYGASTGSVTITSTGGTTPDQFKMGSGSYQSSGTFSGLNAGAYTVTVKDANNCTATSSVTITQPAAALATSSTQTNVACNGGSTGAIDLTVTGGTSAYTYSWTKTGVPAFTATTQDLSGLSAGTYNVTVTDANSCTSTASVTISENTTLSSSISSQSNVGCYGASTGSVTITATGGTTSYQYKIDAGSYGSSNVFSGLAAGAHSVAVKDANNCTATSSITITQPAAVLATSSTQTNVLCFGNSTGAIDLTVTGGTTAYTYSWTKTGVPAFTATTQDLTGLSAGTYNVTVTDANNCTSTSSVTITQPAAALATSSTQTNVACNGGSTGAIDLTVTGGTIAYTYSWTKTGVPAFAASTQDLSGLTAGTYNVTVTDANSCTSTASVTISENTTLTSSISSQTNVGCYGASTGSVTITATGGTTAYQYKIDAGSYGSSNVFSGLAAGAHSVAVKDANNCTATSSVTITQPAAALTASIVSQMNVGCGTTTGSVTIAATGGTAAYQYKLDAAAYQTGATFAGLAVGTYIITVKDAGNCTTTISVNIIATSTLNIAVASQTNNICNGVSNGAVTISTTGGSAPYQYKLNAGSYQSANTFSGLAGGTYIVSVKDALGCTGTLSVIIAEPNAMLISTINTHVKCNGSGNGQIQVNVSGGTPGYQYRLDMGSFQVSNVFTNLGPGTYNITVKDTSGCMATYSTVITQPAAISVNVFSVSHVSCYGNADGNFTLSVTGGTAPYKYKINSGSYQSSPIFTSLAGGYYIVTVKDANNCIGYYCLAIYQPELLTINVSAQTNITCGSAGLGSFCLSATGGSWPYLFKVDTGAYQTGNCFSNLEAGSYAVSVRDSNGCISSTTVIITSPAGGLTASLVSKSNVSCYGAGNGSACVTAAGGMAPYQYKLGNGAYQGTGCFTGLTPSCCYCVTVLDASGCTYMMRFGITQPASALAATVSGQTNIGCTGAPAGSATIAATGGTLPYQYKLGSGSYQVSNIFAGLSAGTYTVTVKDSAGCMSTVSVTIINSASTLVAALSSQVNIGLSGTGSVCFTGQNGIAPYQYKLDAGAYQSSNCFTGLAAGTYTVTVQDASGCTATTSAGISQCTAVITPSVASQVNVGCYGWSTGGVTVTATGGTTPYQYQLGSNGYQNYHVFGSLAAGNYIITVKDAAGCTGVQPVSISQPASALGATVSSQNNVTCNGTNTGSITVNGTGGNAPYQYNISGGLYQSSNVFSNLPAGFYLVGVKDATGCTGNLPVTISQPYQQMVATISEQVNSSSLMATDGSATISVTGGTAPYQYKLDAGAYQASNTFSNLAFGNYTVTVLAANGCTATVIISMTSCTGSITPVIVNKTDVSCYGYATGSVTMGATGGTAPYQYKIGTGAWQNYNVLSGLTAGTYLVMVRDAGGCAAGVYVTIGQPGTALTASILSQTNVACNGSNSGAVTVTGMGGRAPYRYNLDYSGFQNSGAFTGLTAGTHIIYVSDSSGCMFNLAVNITQPYAPLTASIGGITNVNTPGGTSGAVTIAVTGGTAPYQFKLGSGAYQGANTFGGLATGTYTVTVLDANGCSTTQQVTLIYSTATVVMSVASTGNVSCYGGNNGSVCVTATGGTAPYQYKVSGGGYQSSNCLTGLTAGSYLVMAKDASGNESSIPVTLTQPGNALSSSIATKTNVSCYGSNNGSVCVNVAGGTYPYMYKLGTGVYQVSTCFTGLTAGVHVITIKDANGCTTTQLVSISQPSAPLAASVVSVTNTQNNASNGSASVGASGGTAPYQYQLGNGAFQWSNTFNGLAAGCYSVTVKDQNGCITAVTLTINSESGYMGQGGNKPGETLLGDTINNSDVNANVQAAGSNGNGIRIGSEIRVFPNPSVADFTISGITSKDASITIYDMSGKEIVFEKTFVNEHEIKFGNAFANGFYTLVVDDGGSIQSFRISKVY